MRKSAKFMTVILAGAVLGAATFTGCSLVSQDPQADMSQVIAEVDISQSENFDSSLSEYKEAITNKTILKRDLVAYFLNSGSSLVQQGYTYGEAFETLATTLVNNEVLIQYATISTLQQIVENDTSISSASVAVEKFLSFDTEAERYEWLLQYQAEYDEYEGTEDIDYVLLSKYTLYSSINSSIDSYEEDILDADTTDDTSSATLPTGVDEEVENYYPLDGNGNLDYGVYTGYDGYLLTQSGAYQDDSLEGTTRYSRMSAYSKFVQTLDNNYLITDDDNVKDVLSLSFVQSEYVDILRQQVVTNYFSFYESSLAEAINTDPYTYLKSRYDELLAQQKAAYSSSNSDFETALSNLSSSSFILYTPENSLGNGNSFGYVYNILLPFSAAQSSKLSELSALLENDVIDENGYYAARNELLQAITTTDQRSSWFNGGVDYSFDATDSVLDYYSGDGSRNILFFENNLLNTDRYEKLDKYYGLYTYNGTAIKNADGSYTLIANKLNIDEMLEEIEGYMNFVMGDSTLSFISTENYYDVTDFTYKSSSNEVPTGKTSADIDYSNFIYAYGNVNLNETFSATNLTNPDSDWYKAMSVVNELQYAYTTDTSVLSQFIGYSVSAYSTSYIAEFEYAAQYAINKGVGTFVVCAGDYGWHIMYVTYVLSPGEKTYTPDWSNINVEGTFENLFYEMLKTSDLENASSRWQLELLQMFYEEDITVTLYESRYSDLTSLTTSAS